MPDNIKDAVEAAISEAQKPWYQSRGVIGSIIAIVAGVAGSFGYGIPVEVQGQAVDVIAAGGALIGGALALWGRLKAVHRVR